MENLVDLAATSLELFHTSIHMEIILNANANQGSLGVSFHTPATTALILLENLIVEQIVLISFGMEVIA